METNCSAFFGTLCNYDDDENCFVFFKTSNILEEREMEKMYKSLRKKFKNNPNLKKFVTGKFVSKQFHVISEHYDNWIRGWGDEKTFSYVINPKLDGSEASYTFFSHEYIGDDLDKIFS